MSAAPLRTTPPHTRKSSTLAGSWVYVMRGLDESVEARCWAASLLVLAVQDSVS